MVLVDRAERDEFLEVTNANGVMTRPVWVLMNQLPMFEIATSGDLGNALWLQDRLVSIPSSVP